MNIAEPAPFAGPTADDPVRDAVRAFLHRLEKTFSVLDAILYGSRARGDHGPESDADLAVILAGPRGDRFAAVSDMGSVEFDVMLETGIRIQALPLWEEEFDRPELFANPALIEIIKREGLRL